MTDEERLCYVLHNPERAKAEGATVHTYLLTERVPFELKSVAHLVNAVAAANLGIDPPKLVWFDFAPAGKRIAQLEADEIPAFQCGPVRGKATQALKTIAVSARQRAADVVETVAHETYHVARGGDEDAAVSYGQRVREILADTDLLGVLTGFHFGG